MITPADLAECCEIVRLHPPGPMVFQVWHGQYAVRFHTNLCGRVYSLVREDEASRFHSIDAARRAIAEHRLPTELTTIKGHAD